MLHLKGKILLAVFIAFSFSASVLEAKGNGHDKKEKQSKKGYDKHYDHDDDDDDYDDDHYYDHDWQARDYPAYYPPKKHSNFDDRIRYIVIQNSHTGYVQLPPGIRKNIARGKRIPPGLVYSDVPVQVLHSLPTYPGAQWRIYGSDLVLVNRTNQIIQQTLPGLFR